MLGAYHKQKSGRRTSGYHYLSDKAASQGYEIVRPNLTSATVVRVIPAVDRQTKRALPYRFSPEELHFSPWTCRLATWVGGLTDTISFVCEIPEGIKKGLNPGLLLPPDHLRRKVMRASKTEQYKHWIPYLYGGAKAGPAIGYSQVRGFLHCIVAYHGGRDYTADPLKRRVMLLPKSARESLETLCDARDPTWSGSQDDVRAFKVGDWLGSVAQDGFLPGKLLTIRSDAAAKSDPSSTGMNLSGSAAAGYAGTGSGGGNKRKIPLYECVLGAEQSIPEDWPAALYRPWEEALQFFDPGEQVMLLASVLPLDMIRYSFDGMDYAPDSIMKGRVISTPRAEQNMRSEAPAEQAVAPEVVGPAVPFQTPAIAGPPPDTSSAPWNNEEPQPFAFGGAETGPTPSPESSVARPEGPPLVPDTQPVGDPADVDQRQADQLARLREAQEKLKQ